MVTLQWMRNTMIITYQNGNYFKIQSGDFALLIDPENQRSYRGTRIILNTLKPALAEAPDAKEKDAPVWFDHQGEYEVQGVRICGWSAGYDPKDKAEHTAYRIMFDDMKIVVLGYLTKELGAEIVSELTGADIAIVPAGGKPYLSESAVAKLVRQLEPGIVIPSLMKDPKAFMKELGKSDAKPEDKLVIKKKDIKEKAMEVVWLRA